MKKRDEIPFKGSYSTISLYNLIVPIRSSKFDDDLKGDGSLLHTFITDKRFASFMYSSSYQYKGRYVDGFAATGYLLGLATFNKDPHQRPALNF